MPSPTPVPDETYALLAAAFDNPDPASPEAQGQLRGSFSAAFALLEGYKDRVVDAVDDDERSAHVEQCVERLVSSATFSCCCLATNLIAGFRDMLSSSWPV